MQRWLNYIRRASIFTLMVTGAVVCGLGIATLISKIQSELYIPFLSRYGSGLAWFGAGVLYGWLAARYGFIPRRG